MNKIKIIEDLGMIFLRETSNQKRHALILECPLCEKHFRAGQYDYNTGKITKCREIVVKSQNIVEQANSNPNNTSLPLSCGHII